MNMLQKVFDQAQSRFDSEAALGFFATYQFCISDGGDYYLIIEDGKCSIYDGLRERSDIRLTMNHETFRSVLFGSLDGMQAFMFGQIKVSGDLFLAKKLVELFSLTDQV